MKVEDFITGKGLAVVLANPMDVLTLNDWLVTMELLDMPGDDMRILLDNPERYNTVAVSFGGYLEFGHESAYRQDDGWNVKPFDSLSRLIQEEIASGEIFGDGLVRPGREALSHEDYLALDEIDRLLGSKNN